MNAVIKFEVNAVRSAATGTTAGVEQIVVGSMHVVDNATSSSNPQVFHGSGNNDAFFISRAAYNELNMKLKSLAKYGYVTIAG